MAGTFNAQTLLECNHDRVIAAEQSLFKTLSPLIGIRDPGNNPIPPTGTMDQVLTPISEFPKNEQHWIVPICFSGIARGLERFVLDPTGVAWAKGRGSVAK